MRHRRGSARGQTSKRSAVRRAAWLPVLATLAFTAGCGSDSDEGEATAGGDSGKSAGTIKLGANVELSGPAANIGTSMLAGFQGAADQINKSGGVNVGDKSYTLEVVECDNRSEPTHSVTCARRLSEEDVLWALTPDYGFEPAYEVMKKKDVISAATSASATMLLAKDPEGNPGLFFQGVTFDVLVQSFLSQVRALRPGVKSFAALLPDDENGRGYESLFGAAAKKVGVKYLGTEFYPPSATGDFTSFLTKLKAKRADLVYLSFAPQVTVPAAKQAGQLDVAPYFGSQSIVPDDFAGTSLSGHEMIIQNLAMSDVSVDQLAERDQEAWQFIKAAAKGKETSGNVAGLSYLEIQLLKEAIEAAGSIEPEAVRKAMLTARWEGALGPAVVQKNHSFTNPMSVFLWDKDNQVTENVFAQPLDAKPRDVFKVAVK